ncbi:DUF2975 domain-containing protein [Glutamicibacter sp. X7]
MGRATILLLKIVLAAAILGGLFVQCFMIPLAITDGPTPAPPNEYQRISVLLYLGLLLLALQVCALCVWRLASMVHKRTVFSPAAFKFVNTIIGCVGFAALLTLALGVILAPGEAVPPGIVLLVGGLALAMGGVALIVVILRLLLKQATDTELEATHLRDELGEVI